MNLDHITPENKVVFEIHNRDGRLSQRIVQTINTIRNIVSWGCGNIYDVPLMNPEGTEDKDFASVTIKFAGFNPTPPKPLVDHRIDNTDTSKGKGEISLSVFFWKGNLYGLGCKKDGIWHQVSDSFQVCRRPILGKRFHFDSPHLATISLKIGPAVLLKAITSLVNSDETKWRSALLDIVTHFFESARILPIQDKIAEAFSVDLGDVNWMHKSLTMEPIMASYIRGWKDMCIVYTFSFWGGGWDPYRSLAIHGIQTREDCERILGVVKYISFDKEERLFQAHKKKSIDNLGEGSTGDDGDSGGGKGKRGSSDTTGGRHEKGQHEGQGHKGKGKGQQGRGGKGGGRSSKRSYFAPSVCTSSEMPVDHHHTCGQAKEGDQEPGGAIGAKKQRLT